MELGTKLERGGQGRRQWNRVGAQGTVRALFGHLCGVPEFLITPLLTGPVGLGLKSQSAIA